MRETGAYSSSSEQGAENGREGALSTGAWRALLDGFRWATGAWSILGGLFFLDVLVSGLATIPAQAVILSAIRDRPVDALFGVGWHLEMLAELVIGHRDAFLAAAWLLGLGVLVYWVLFALLWGGLARAWSLGRRGASALLQGAVEASGPVLAVRLVGMVPLAASIWLLRLLLSLSAGAIVWVRLSLVGPALMVLFMVHGMVTYWWIAAALGAKSDRWFVGSLVSAWRAFTTRWGMGARVHLLFLLAWGGLAWASVMAIDPGRTWSWPVWILVVVVELCAALRLWLYAAALVSRGLVLQTRESSPAR